MRSYLCVLSYLVGRLVVLSMRVLSAEDRSLLSVSILVR